MSFNPLGRKKKPKKNKIKILGCGYTTIKHQYETGASPPTAISCAQILEIIHEKFSSVDISQSPTSSKNKGVFPSDTALEKLVYLAYRNISEKWTMPLANWALISQQLAIKFGDIFEIM